MKTILHFFLIVICCALVRCAGGQLSDLQVHFDPDKPAFTSLSEYRLFRGPLKELRPAEGVLPYTLNSPLFSDYASKARFVWMPKGSSAKWSEEEVFEFPEGAVLIKNFFYGKDSGRRIIETRLLVRNSQGWDARPYIWNEAQTEAVLKVAGGKTAVNLVEYPGTLSPDHPDAGLEFEYIIPNKNQCKGCHSFGGKMQLIGPKARNLNRTVEFEDGAANQLDKWIGYGYLSAAPPAAEWPVIADYNDPAEPLRKRALSYLEINCGHCHRQEGPAATSGLHLLASEKKMSNLGYCKTPVAAGKGSGGLHYDIVPGDPEHSILLYRMLSDDPGVRMPELGRQLMHREGVDLIKTWITSLEGSCADTPGQGVL